MTDENALPFHSFTFTLIADKRPRAALRMRVAGEGMYELHVERGSASNPTSQFTREVPVEVAQRLKDELREIGVFGWDEAYGDATAPGSRRWTVSTVFKEGVFSVSSKGGSDVPSGFNEMLEELYRLDFPRPAESRAETAPAIPTSIGDMAAYASKAGFPNLSSLNTAEMQQRMKEEFRHMAPDEQNQLLDALASTGMASRDWWERFFRS